MTTKQIASLFLVVSICVRVSTSLVQLSPSQPGIYSVIGRHGASPRPCRVALAATPPSKAEMMSTDYLICGGGPAGLLSAIMLAQKFPQGKIQVYDRLSQPPSPTDETVWGDTARFYLLGIGGRGLTSLQRYGVFEDVVKASTNVPGRKDWTPQSEEGVERMLTDRRFTPMVLPREKLVSVLHQYIVDNYSTRVDMNYGYQVRPKDFSAGDDGTSVVVQISKLGADEESWTDVTTNLVIAADGSARTFANQMEQEDRANGAANPFSVTRYEDDNERTYKKIPFQIQSDWRKDMNYSVRSKGDRVTFDALPANDKGDYVGVLLLKSDDEMAQANVDPDKFQDFLDDTIPQFSRLFDRETIETIAKQPPSFLPCFRFVGPRLHQGKRTVLIGDCAHTVKPYFGMGANSALEDVKLLGESIESTADLTEAVLDFSKKRAPDIETLVRVSHDLDRPGLPGVFTFLVPIIMDAIFSKVAPQFFKPNVITMLQDEEITFQEAAGRKRLDRVAQVAILGSGFTVFFTAAKFFSAQLFGLLKQYPM